MQLSKTHVTHSIPFIRPGHFIVWVMGFYLLCGNRMVSFPKSLKKRWTDHWIIKLREYKLFNIRTSCIPWNNRRRGSFLRHCHVWFFHLRDIHNPLLHLSPVLRPHGHRYQLEEITFYEFIFVARLKETFVHLSNVRIRFLNTVIHI